MSALPEQSAIGPKRGRHGPLPAWRQLAIGVLFSLVACHGQTIGTPQPFAYGYLVLGVSGAARLGLAAGDTLPEVPPIRAIASVRKAAERDAQVGGFQPRCSRYFSTPSVIVVLFAISCERGADSEDGGGIAAYLQAGETVMIVNGPTWGYYSRVVPSSRSPS